MATRNLFSPMVDEVREELRSHFLGLHGVSLEMLAVLHELNKPESERPKTPRLVYDTVTLDGAGAGTIELPIRQGYAWEVQRISYASGTAAPTFQTYTDIVDDGHLVQAQIGLIATLRQATGLTPSVFAFQKVIFVVTGGAAGGFATCSARVVEVPVNSPARDTPMA